MDAETLSAFLFLHRQGACRECTTRLTGLDHNRLVEAEALLRGEARVHVTVDVCPVCREIGRVLKVA
jgi:hypothetical protein